ncbi:XRE family transcriptional regulator [Fictibacillus aquaticus]|uniref:Uncharacterized protein n=1 Tax=Fictibacillus aquaticus TaxID=2021314 RepID=A0A235FA23_9BACL|nr:hypothetical protein [Fictibacillus aquaticus]OYD57894.1 hypothetical protein CGZ90_08310 [Fictibacillus aquaticus]
MGVGKYIKENRGKQSQLRLSMDLNVSRESVSAYETERARVPMDISQTLMDKWDDPFYAMEVAHDYTAGGWVKRLDGNAVDLHRASVAAKAREELQEALEAISAVCLANQPVSMNEHDRHQLKETVDQAIDGIYALSHYVAVICTEYGVSWNDSWKHHTQKLIANGYMQRGSSRI